MAAIMCESRFESLRQIGLLDWLTKYFSDKLHNERAFFGERQRFYLRDRLGNHARDDKARDSSSKRPCGPNEESKTARVSILLSHS